MPEFRPRPAQKQVLQFRSGRMGVAAVPGSGKTQVLSYLASRLIAENYIQEDQEVLVVTLVNSAVDNFSSRIRGFIQEENLMPGLGYRVRTLHGLAHDIVRERPGLVNLENQFQILDEREAQRVLEDAANRWLRSHPEFIETYQHLEQNHSQPSKSQKDWLELVISIASAFIRQAKDLQATPAVIREKIMAVPDASPLLHLGADIYESYQQGLQFRSAVDFDDLIRMALLALQMDSDYLNRLRQRWPYILEDEAQDSSHLQEQILRLLVGKEGNWVRVGDPNQAIFETFTTASPAFLMNFLREPGVVSLSLPNSGRSTLSIMSLANHLVDWTRNRHTNPQLREALQHAVIEPTPPNDPQPNPPDKPEKIFLHTPKLNPDKELDTIARSIRAWLAEDPAHKEKTLAVLVTRNDRGAKLAEIFQHMGIEYVELLKSSHSARETATILSTLLQAIQDPASQPKLIGAFRVFQQCQFNANEEDQSQLNKKIEKILHKCKNLEEFLWPMLEIDWLKDLEANGEDPEILRQLENFRQSMRRWQAAALLPIDQLLLTISKELFTQPADLALAHKLAILLEQRSQTFPGWQMSLFIEELNSVAQNRSRLVGFSEEDTGFVPEHHKGKVVIATMHKAKGLEWDRVYLTSVNNYDFPSAAEYDRYIGEKWFVRDQLNLEEEALAKLKALLSNDIAGLYLEEGLATWEARLGIAAERLRLLYVGITRAREELIITWNDGRQGDAQPALAFVALSTYWKEKKNDHSA